MCQCIDRVNGKLREQDLRLVTVQPMSADLDFLPPRVVLGTARPSGSRKRRPDFAATFCPFCGERYEQPKAATSEPQETTHARA
jgi:hypothetical protein